MLNMLNQPSHYCPKCGQMDSVSLKLTTFDIRREYFQGDGFYVKYPEKYDASPLTHGEFIESHYCSLCELAFLPDEILPSIGIEPVDFRGAIGSPYRAFSSLGHLLSDRSLKTKHGKLFSVILTFRDQPDVRTLIDAVDSDDAKDYISKKYPDATIVDFDDVLRSSLPRT